ncbi:MAG: YtxH domain-containing protein [Nitrospira sp.]|nr:YtxH domain-containing protein [Nitrospira sp.]
MTNKINGGVLFLTGMIIGGGVGLLLAPTSGARTRRRLMVVAKDVEQGINGVAADARLKINQIMERGWRVAA